MINHLGTGTRFLFTGPDIIRLAEREQNKKEYAISFGFLSSSYG